MKKVKNIPFTETALIRTIIDSLENNQGDPLCICLYDHDLPGLWKKFRKHYSLVRAGGGLVFNPKGKILFIFRNGKWDLPKGKADDNEEIEATALREVQEECGINDLALLDFIMDTYHTYGSLRNQKLKKTSWFLMHSKQKELVPQTEEGITDIKWIKPDKLAKVWKNTFPSVVDVVQAELAKINRKPEKVKWHQNANFE